MRTFRDAVCRGLYPPQNQCPADSGELQSFWEQAQDKKVQVSVRDRPSGQVERTKDLESENQKASPASITS